MKKKIFVAIFVLSIIFMFQITLVEAAKENKITLAISPFKNLMKKPDLDWMKEGFAETLTTKLNYVRGLNLVERVQLNEVMNEIKLSMAGITGKDISNVGKLVGADYLVIGSFQKLDQGGHSNLKINARVINVKTGEIEQGRAVSVKGPYASVFEIEEELAGKIAGQLGVGISDTEMRYMDTNETTSVLAYELYNQAKYETDAVRKEKLLLRALQEDPSYAKAHLLLGSYYSLMAVTDESMEKPALKHLNLALEKDPELYEAHSALGDYYYRKSRLLRENMEEEEEAAAKKAKYHLKKFIEKKHASKAKYYIWKVEKAREKLKKLES
jgi:TolB-like protein